jgi:uncharacterized membrane protein YdbT with pleckstrin-like domain
MDQDPTPPIPPNLPPQPPRPTADKTQQPVAYDSQGRPLYAAPVTTETAIPQVVHFTRAVSPVQPEVSPEVKAKHDESVRLFPQLNLSDAEYVISAVRRHPIGLAIPVILTGFCVALILSLTFNYMPLVESFGIIDPPPYGAVLLSGILLSFLFLVGGYVAIWVYINNRFFLTNESVIQEIQVSLFSKHEQTVSLVNIEDASYRQQGILQSLFDYGSIRLSTEGDETTYRFYYVANPKREIAILNNAIEAFKNGRPTDPNEQD